MATQVVEVEGHVHEWTDHPYRLFRSPDFQRCPGCLSLRFKPSPKVPEKKRRFKLGKRG